MFAAMKTGNMATYTPPVKTPVAQSSSSGFQAPRDDSQRVQLKVLGIPDGTDPVSIYQIIFFLSQLFI